MWDPKVKELVEVTEQRSEPAAPLVMGDIPPFVSTVDGSIISGRAALREHNKRHGVTNAADFTHEWERAAEKRAEFFAGKSFDRHERIEALKYAYEKHRRTK